MELASFNIGDKKYTLTAPQTKVALCDKRFICLNAGRRFGKTHLSRWLIARHALSPEVKKYVEKKGDYNITYIAPIINQARDLMWKPLKSMIPEKWISYKNEQRMEMQLINGCWIYIKSGEDPDHLVGTSINYLIIDEAALQSEKVWEYVEPNLSDCKGSALFISTPRGYNWFYEKFHMADKHPEDWASFQFTTIEGGNVPLDEIERAKAQKPWKLFVQEYLASFETMANRVYDSYDRNECDCDLDPTWGLGDIHVGMDFNVNPMTATISVVEGDYSYTFDEIHEPNSNTFEIAKKIKEKYPQADVYVYPDPTGKRQQSSSCGKSDFLILEEAGFHVCAPYAPYKQRDKFNTTNVHLTNSLGEHHGFIAKGTCPNLRKSLEGYSYKENGDPDKTGGLDHISDAYSYFVNYKFPLKPVGRVYKPELMGI